VERQDLGLGHGLRPWIGSSPLLAPFSSIAPSDWSVGRAFSSAKLNGVKAPRS
jgi:hypothetical protein